MNFPKDFLEKIIDEKIGEKYINSLKKKEKVKFIFCYKLEDENNHEKNDDVLADEIDSNHFNISQGHYRRLWGEIYQLFGYTDPKDRKKFYNLKKYLSQRLKNWQGTKSPFQNSDVKTNEKKHIIRATRESREKVLTKIPEKFRNKVRVKTKKFVGRDFLFNEIKNFIENNDNGYFHIIAEPGMGKTAIASQYLLQCPSICYFNSYNENPDNPEEIFKKSISQQLKAYFKDESDFLDSTNGIDILLFRASEYLLKNQDKKLVIVIDALDEVKITNRTHNLLNLPSILPPNIFIITTRRPFEISSKRLTIDSNATRCIEIDLKNSKYDKYHELDIKKYLKWVLEKEKDSKILKKWIKDQGKNNDYFVEYLTEKSQYNFMYIEYVLKEIIMGKFSEFTLNELPEGLEAYYENHWERMGMNNYDEYSELKSIILFVILHLHQSEMCERGLLPTYSFVSDIVDVEPLKIKSIIREWFQFFDTNQVEETFNFYHLSFIDFIREKSHKNLYAKYDQEARRRIDQYSSELF